jgi:hypothetical protein
MMYTFFPLISVGLLKAVGFIDSLFLRTRRDRIIPLVTCGIWYFWIWFVWRNLPEYPAEAITLTFAIWMSASLGLMANIIMKVSLHAIAMGVMVSFLVALGLNQGINFGIYISVALIIAGAVCTSRFIISDHTQKEIYGGFATGILSVLIAQVVT